MNNKLNGDLNKANDFLQDLFLKLIEKPSAFDSNRKFSTWIYNVAFNLCKNEYKKNQLLNIDNAFIQPEKIIVGEEKNLRDENKYTRFNTQLSIQLEKLDENQRTTFILKFKEGFTIKEIGMIMECSDGTVKSRLFYTLKKLSINLKEYNPIAN